MRLGAAATAGVAVTLFLSAGPSAAVGPQKAGTAPEVTATSSPPSGSIAGAVAIAADGQPVARARVILTSPLLAQPRVTVSDDAGRFAFTEAAPGTYELLVMRSGFASVPNARTRGLPVRVQPGQALNGVVLRLQPESVIPGRVHDEDGSPLAGAEVEALSLRASAGRQSLVPVSTTRSDDRGDFRLTGLSAGQYFVVARDGAFARVRDTTGTLRYPATFYPGGITAAGAQLISVGVGQEAQRIDFRVSLVKPARVSGRLRPPDKRPLQNGAVLLVPGDGSILDTLPAEDIDITPDGRFMFRNVPPGAYQLRARASVDARQATLFGSFAVQVLPRRDVDGLVVPLVPGAVIQGRVEWTGAERPDLHAVRVRAPFADNTSFGDALSGTVAADGTFRLRGVMSGRHYLTVEGLPSPWAVVAITVGGRDMLLQSLDVHEGEQLHNVRVTVSDIVTDVTGVVRDEKGRTAPDALVLVMPPGATAWSAVDARFQATRANADGRYRISGLPPGAYRVAALSGSDELAAWRPDWLRRVDPHATAVSLGAADKRTLDLVAVPADAVMPATTR